MTSGRTPHREIERKFLVRKLPDDLTAFPHHDLEQGYLAITRDGVQVRLRRGGGKQSLTFKRACRNSREEREVQLTAEQFAVLWPGTEGKRLTKTRYEVPFGNRIVEIDVYSGRHQGLVVAEVEFDDEDTARDFVPPNWLGEDVTHDPRYSNQLLASHSSVSELSSAATAEL
jgi:adenylate cyclase